MVISLSRRKGDIGRTGHPALEESASSAKTSLRSMPSAMATAFSAVSKIARDCAVIFASSVWIAFWPDPFYAQLALLECVNFYKKLRNVIRALAMQRADSWQFWSAAPC